MNSLSGGLEKSVKRQRRTSDRMNEKKKNYDKNKALIYEEQSTSFEFFGPFREL
jgi:hypothetical protein